MRTQRTRMAAAGMASLGAWLGGCAPAWRPTTTAPVQTAPVDHWYETARYRPARYPVYRLYERRDLADESSKKISYPRIDEIDRRIEGIAAGRQFDRLRKYYPRVWGEKVTPDRPLAPIGKEGGAILEVDPPLLEFPARLRIGETVETRADVKQFWANGQPGLQGQVTRSVTLEGVETVGVKAGRFADCLRLRVEMELKLGLPVHLRSREYQWMAPGMGEVRRVLQVWGLAFLSVVDQSFEYQLAMADAFPQTAPTTAPAAEPRWTGGAILTLWKGLSPYLGGLVVESNLSPDAEAVRY